MSQDHKAGSEEDDNVDDDHYVPPEDQRGFGAGYRRRRVAFVPAAPSEPTVQTQRSPSSAAAAAAGLLGDRYLSIVLGNKRVEPPVPNQADEAQDLSAKRRDQNETAERSVQATTTMMTTCEICGQSLELTSTTTRDHETSIAHQVCLAHSHPPSHLDREHVGLKYLADYGWDPDSRTGLGARREGIRVPIKAKEKRDTAGLGVGTPVDEEDLVVVKPRPAVKKEAKITKVNAKEVRRIEDDKRKRADRLRQSFYGEDLSRYLGTDG